MVNDEKDIELIERYFDLDLSESELSVFDKRIQEDSEFFKKVSLYAESNAYVTKTYQTKEDVARIKKWDDIISSDQKIKGKVISWKWIGSIAAVFAMLFFGWKYADIIISQPDFEYAAKEAWNKEVGLDYSLMRGEYNDSLKNVIDTAYYKYTIEEYKEAIEVLSGFDSSVLYYEDALLLQGLSLYKSGNTTKALQILKTLSEYPTQKKAKVALWYMGLIYLDQNDIKRAEQFIELPEDENDKIKLKDK